jgi:GWxTD domain-containing protein
MQLKSNAGLLSLILLIFLFQGCSSFFAEKTFSSKEKILNDMFPVLSNEQFRELESLNTNNDRNTFIGHFWSEIDSTGNDMKNEYLKRLKYTDQHFPDKYGWGRSDRKRIYLVYGPPLYIDRNNFADIPLDNFAKVKAIEVWHYGRPGKNNSIKTIFEDITGGEMKFIFADLIGSGNYVILYSSENPGDIDSRILQQPSRQSYLISN